MKKRREHILHILFFFLLFFFLVSGRAVFAEGGESVWLSEEVRAGQNKRAADVRSADCEYREAGRKHAAGLAQDFVNGLPKSTRRSQGILLRHR